MGPGVLTYKGLVSRIPFIILNGPSILESPWYLSIISKSSISSSEYEIDFLTTDSNNLVPIEVKSSEIKNHKSINEFSKNIHLKYQEEYYFLKMIFLMMKC